MALSDPTECIIHDGSCIRHQPSGMLQILSLDLAEISVDGGLVELYGYIAVRDNVDPLFLNRNAIQHICVFWLVGTWIFCPSDPSRACLLGRSIWRFCFVSLTCGPQCRVMRMLR